MNSFKNKSIYFFGDSNLTKPYYLEYLRAEIINTHKQVSLYNKSVPGARLDMLTDYIDEEISVLKPDYAVLCFGINDLGIWLYDAFKPFSEEISSARAERIKRYCDVLEKVIVYLKSKKITPIYMTPLCVNDDIPERENIETVKDNREKSAIKSTLFKKATFKNINDSGVKALCEKGAMIARNHDVEIWDLSSFVRQRADNGCFFEDGVHYNAKGHKLIAESVYENMFGEKMAYYPVDKRIKTLSCVEAEERAYFFVKYVIVLAYYGKKEGEELTAAAENFIKEKGYAEGLTKETADKFFRFVSSRKENSANISCMIQNLS